MNNKKLFIIAGPNGSGKTTLSKDLLKEYSLEFINADEIAKDIASNIENVRISAGKQALLKIDQLLLKGKSFALETTLSGSYVKKVIQKAKKNKYQIILIFVFLDSPEMCMERIKIRVQYGGHNIPADDVIRRYLRGKDNLFKKYLPLVHSVSIYYNGYKVPVLVAKGSHNKIDIIHEQLFNFFIKGAMQ